MGCLKLSYYEEPPKEKNLIFSWGGARQKGVRGKKNRVTGYGFGFNGQEKDNEIAGIGNSNTAQFWQYDTRLGRRWNLDPKPQVRISDYAVMGDNPIVNVDVLGDSYVLSSTKDKNGEINKVGVGATVYIKGNGASKSRAEELTKKAAETFKTKTVDGVQVSYKITYIYDSKKLKKDLKVGENLMEFANGKVYDDNGNEVAGLTPNEGPAPSNDDVHRVGNTSKVANIGTREEQNNTALHESGHFIGLDERYQPNSNYTGYEDVPKYKGNIMGLTGTKLHNVQYRSIIRNAQLIFKGSRNWPIIHIATPEIFLDDKHTIKKDGTFKNHGQNK